MKNILEVNKKIKKIDDDYFTNYGGKNYSESYLSYTISPHQIIKEFLDKGIEISNLLDIGCASGELVRDFRRLGVKAYGIENNKSILKKCVVPQYCTLMDMRNLGEIKDNTFSVLYTNSLMYLWPNEIPSVLKQMNRIVEKAVYICVPFLKKNQVIFEDPYRTFLANEKWWENQFITADFYKVSSNIYKKV